MNILDLPMQENDAEAATIGDYLRALLTRVWEEEESFSGKRPFGNSGWKYDVYKALLVGKKVKGKLDSEGYIADIDDRKADEIISEAIGDMS